MSINTDALRPPRERGMGPALLLALLMHVLLVALITFGVHWQSHTPDAVQAELWAPTPRLAAPPAPQPTPQPTPQPAPTPQPQPQPAPQVAPRPTPSPDAAEIALRQQRKLEQERQARAQALAQEQEQKRRAQQLAEQERREQLEQRKFDEQKQQKLQEQKLAQQKAAQKLREQKLHDKQLAQLQQQSRADYMKNLMSQAGSAGGSSAGNAATSAGPSGGYAAQLGTLVRQNVIYPQVDQISGNPKVELSVTLDPNSGQVLGVTVKRSSGVASWDQAVVRAVQRIGRFPSDHGHWFSPMSIVAGPRDHD